ncbi:hypothetical protein [Amycolatopsis sp. H20-H5]|uniref:hypothetical protein n=1 Tax=Amycolatopsis sp. H20-H5 TaxID=3046309 RepID=UPI002DBAA18F|nr:hypothetical protein [Amycolatopsis sp. H20-H5]MEC3978029.1 hypothetical protein [Amycolatopsis sp. H20-H5]
MSAKVVLITDTSSGIGLAAAAAQAGWRTVATMRDSARATALLAAAEIAGVTDLVDVRHLDVTDPNRSCAASPASSPTTAHSTR